jgi:DNA-binding transcriptional MerR regulator
MMGERAYLSIGEVLSLLKNEFPDITISKIRFLESQGLLDPERTPSGYRKFYDADVERLRWILRQQRENFLPLKIIKGRLGSEEPAGVVVNHEEQVVVRDREPEPEPMPEPEPVPEPPAVPEPPRRPVVPAFPIAEPTSGVNLTLDELAQSSGLSHAQVRELAGYGLLSSRMVGGISYYDDEALAVASLAAGFLRFGVEARHLRAYKSAAEREAGQFEAIVLPLLKQRNPQARQQALDTLEELSKLAEGLRSALLRQALHDLAGG